DGLWSLMLINKDPNLAHEVKIIFQDGSRAHAGFASPIEVVQFSGLQYQLNSDRDQPKPIKSVAPAHFTIGRTSAMSLPAYSLTVIRGKL
ncbi:MAG TPA: hypothetical protein VLN44_02405, partial [Pyrinomonadaceae bacterium]|nr:hypothetical protein [Pyrinomonadaceae bacterium]